MTTSATVPLTVAPEAATRIAALGLQAAVERMIDRARRSLPELERIEVLLYDRYEAGDEPGIAIETYSRRPFDPSERPDQDLIRWTVTEFPPEVLQHVLIDYHPGAPHAG
jgi:hypothetical protein